MSSPFKQRTTLYSLIIVCVIIETGFAIFTALMNGFAPLPFIFGPITATFSILTLVWTSVLLAFNNRPTSEHTLTRARIHFRSMLCMAVIFVACAIMYSTQLPPDCNTQQPDGSDGWSGLWCGFDSTVGTLAYIIAILSSAAAFVIRRATPDFSTNVCAADRKHVDGSVVLKEMA
ncbi:hypothetical protein CPC08DRAFT_711472 [Agrocybe pediades]|nr:hypothetical protein CPC08DRAFT_711472 [Agrocybe pediades]